MPSGEQLRASFDIAFGAAALPALHEDAVYITGPATIPTLFDLAAKMVMEVVRTGPSIQPVDSRHAILYAQATASLGVLLEVWLDWLNKPLGGPEDPRAAQQSTVAADINLSGAPPMSREEAVVERLRAEGRAATQRDLYHTLGNADLDSMPDRRGLMATCEVLDALLRDHVGAGYGGACSLGAAAGSLLEVLIGGRDGEFAREVGHRGRMLAELATALGPEAAEVVKRAADGSVAAFREERWRRDGEDAFWSDVMLAARTESAGYRWPSERPCGTATMTGPATYAN